MENASYHCKVINNAPTQSLRKQEIVKWFAEHNVPHNPHHNKLELPHQVRLNKAKEIYEIDEIAQK